MNTLPQSILNLIGEFNANHRDDMYYVLMELENKERTCYNCGEYIQNVDERKTRKWLSCKYVFCSIACVIQGEEDIFERYAIRNRQRIAEFNRVNV